ncbi:proton-coupled folate transporter-like [Wyeomyia smithii]|uniref:proton-coupled folate transporter-like n=1 Tax=Wyeomyia smithii TaxID=174621 RepID=UPI002467BA31|nr:proton-coupled folate transporter-like [Wyeomyia smithii]
MKESDRNVKRNRFKKLISYVTVEPVVLFFLLSVISSTGLRVFEYEKACATKLNVDLSVCEYFAQLEDDNICETLDTLNSTLQQHSGKDRFDETNRMQFARTVCSAKEAATNEVALLNSYRSIITGLVQAVVLIFLGSWSDRVGLRKPCLLIPIAADIISFCVLITSALFMREIALEVTGILPNLITALSGGVPLIITGIYSYLTICTSEKNRTFRFAWAAVVIATVPILANFASGFLYKSLGFIKLCSICIMFDAIGLLYGLFILKEPTPAKRLSEGPEQTKQYDSTNYQQSLRKLFDLTLVLDCVRMVLRKREHKVRTILMLTLFVYFINYGALGDTESAAILAYLKFNWITHLGTWISYDLLTTLLGTLLAMGVLSKRCGVPDFLICVFSVCFTLIAKPIMAYAVSAVKPYLYYVATSIDMFEGSKTVAIRSIVSKLVEQDEIGKMLAIMGIVDSTQVVIFPTLYSVVYLKSQEFFIGTVFLVCEAFLLLSLVLYLFLLIFSKDSDKLQASHSEDGVDNPAMEITALASGVVYLKSMQEKFLFSLTLYVKFKMYNNVLIKNNIL